MLIKCSAAAAAVLLIFKIGSLLHTPTHLKTCLDTCAPGIPGNRCNRSCGSSRARPTSTINGLGPGQGVANLMTTCGQWDQNNNDKNCIQKNYIPSQNCTWRVGGQGAGAQAQVDYLCTCLTTGNIRYFPWTSDVFFFLTVWSNGFHFV